MLRRIIRRQSGLKAESRSPSVTHDPSDPLENSPMTHVAHDPRDPRPMTYEL